MYVLRTGFFQIAVPSMILQVSEHKVTRVIKSVRLSCGVRMESYGHPDLFFLLLSHIFSHSLALTPAGSFVSVTLSFLRFSDAGKATKQPVIRNDVKYRQETI